MKKQIQVLITGGAGFIGRRSAEVLTNFGFDVTILDINIEKRKAILEKLGDRVKYIEGDVKNKELVFSSIKNKDVVIHLAAGSSFLMYEQSPVYETVNVIHGFLNVLEAVKHYNIKKLIYTSSSAVYEGNPLPYREDMVLCPPDHKAIAKKINEEFAQQYSKRYGITTIGLRPFSVYGYGETDKGCFANVISLFTWAMLTGHAPVVWGDGNQTRDFIFVDDLVEILYRCAVNDIDSHVINAGTGIETSFNTVISIINDYLCLNLEPIFIPIPVDIYAKRLLADTSLQEKMGLRTKIYVTEGILKVIESAKSMEQSLRFKLGNAQLHHSSFLENSPSLKKLPS